MSYQNSQWPQQAWQQPQSDPGYGPQYGYQQTPPPQKKGRGWIVALVSVIALFLLFAIGMVSCTSLLASSVSSSGLYGYDSSIDYLSGDAVGVIDIDGTIQYDGTTSSPEGLKSQLEKAEENNSIKAVVLRVNSGGGTATAGEEMAQYVKNFSKPIVISSGSMNASAAYEISSQADYIFVAKTTMIGSIGTILQFTDLSGLYEKLGISIEDIASTENKNSGSGNRPLTDEERAYYQEMIDQVNETFIETVAEGRGMDKEEVRALATGLTFTGMTAVENGLADELGTLEEACDKAAQLAGISDYQTVSLDISVTSELLSLLDLLGYSTSISGADLAAAIKELESDGALTH